MYKRTLAALLLLPVAALADSPAPATSSTSPCPTGMVCVPAQFVQQAVLQLGLRDQIGGALAQYLQQSEAQHHGDPAHEPPPAK